MPAGLPCFADIGLLFSSPLPPHTHDNAMAHIVYSVHFPQAVPCVEVLSRRCAVCWVGRVFCVVPAHNVNGGFLSFSISAAPRALENDYFVDHVMLWYLALCLQLPVPTRPTFVLHTLRRRCFLMPVLAF